MEEYDVPSAASILASVKEQEARFERLTRALEEERRNVSLQLDRGSLPSDRLVGGTTCGSNQPLAWQQMVMQVNHSSLASHASVCVNEQSSIPRLMLMLHLFHYFHEISLSISFSLSCVRLYWAIALGVVLQWLIICAQDQSSLHSFIFPSLSTTCFFIVSHRPYHLLWVPHGSQMCIWGRELWGCLSGMDNQSQYERKSNEYYCNFTIPSQCKIIH